MTFQGLENQKMNFSTYQYFSAPVGTRKEVKLFTSLKTIYAKLIFINVYMNIQ